MPRKKSTSASRSAAAKKAAATRKRNAEAKVAAAEAPAKETTAAPVAPKIETPAPAPAPEKVVAPPPPPVAETVAAAPEAPVAEKAPVPEPPPVAEKATPPPVKPKSKPKAPPLPRELLRITQALNAAHDAPTPEETCMKFTRVLQQLMRTPTKDTLDAVLFALRDGRSISPSVFQTFLVRRKNPADSRLRFLHTVLQEIALCMRNHRPIDLNNGAIRSTIQNSALTDLLVARISRLVK